jgi:hypothetical protein
VIIWEKKPSILRQDALRRCAVRSRLLTLLGGFGKDEETATKVRISREKLCLNPCESHVMLCAMGKEMVPTLIVINPLG